MLHNIGIDIGGTKIAAGIVDSAGSVIYQNRVLTPKAGRNEIIDSLKSVIGEMQEHARIKGLALTKVGIGTAGQVDFSRGMILSGTANIKDWGNIPLAGIISEFAGLPVYIDNDVNALCLAEQQFGSAKGFREVVCLALGTGVGGAVITNGSMMRGAWGGAAELGHTTIDMNGKECNCGMKGCLETYASGTWIARRMIELVEKAEVHGDYPAEITAEEVFRLYQKGDPLAEETVSIMIKGLSYGLVNLIHTFNPQVIVLGGGVMSGGQWIVDRLKIELQRIGLQTLIRDTEIRLSGLDSRSGVVGAALLEDSNCW
ncbi:ROK family protein [Bacillus infantis]|uniref:ROK family protein n=1 Tax=Bacillus infantis TaxID=324767 RepID=UPI002004ABDB|nr:ROK family protein [Bacillus infantis]MCK6206140.1 ROK family protein [Bacillus infantis]